MKIKVDFDLCESNALCEALAPQNFEIDDDDFAAVTRLRARLPAAEVWLARAGHPAAYQIRRVR